MCIRPLVHSSIHTHVRWYMYRSYKLGTIMSTASSTLLLAKVCTGKLVASVVAGVELYTQTIYTLSNNETTNVLLN